MPALSSLISAAKVVGLYVVPATLTFSHCVGSVYRVEGSSMQPSINPTDDARYDDYVYVSHLGMRNLDVKRGDVVSFKSMSCGGRSAGEYHIKRVIGLPGDVVNTRSYKLRNVVVPPGYLWIEGDNKRTSLDSNRYGPLPRGLLFGRATYVVWPPSRFGPVERIIPSTSKVKPSGSVAALEAMRSVSGLSKQMGG